MTIYFWNAEISLLFCTLQTFKNSKMSAKMSAKLSGAQTLWARAQGLAKIERTKALHFIDAICIYILQFFRFKTENDSFAWPADISQKCLEVSKTCSLTPKEITAVLDSPAAEWLWNLCSKRKCNITMKKYNMTNGNKCLWFKIQNTLYLMSY